MKAFVKDKYQEAEVGEAGELIPIELGDADTEPDQPLIDLITAIINF